MSSKGSLYDSSLGVNFFDIFERSIISDTSEKKTAIKVTSVYLVEIMSYVIKALRSSESKFELFSDALSYLNRVKQLLVSVQLVSEDILLDRSQEEKYSKALESSKELKNNNSSIDVAAYLESINSDVLLKNCCFNILKVIIRYLKHDSLADEQRISSIPKLVQDLNYFLNRCLNNEIVQQTKKV